MKNFLLSCFLLLSIQLCATLAQAQNADLPTQTVRGTVTDQQSGAPLVGVSVILLDYSPLKGAVTDLDGKFNLQGVPVGRQSFKLSFIGYGDRVVPNVLVTSSKEVVLNLSLEESVEALEAIVVTASADKGEVRNEMATLSARTFNVEETGRYAGSRNDPARMAQNYAGVSGGSDDRNDIIVRGNSPTAILWRLEGINIPNPNHFGALGATGGPVSMLNNNVLATSDFFTAAFPSEYGNALGGVFDLSMRNGNNEQHEFLGQIGFNGFEFGAEGPLGKKGGASYLLNVRYSTLGVFDALGVNFGTGTAVPNFQDVNLKINVPLKAGSKISVFALGGRSSIDLLGSETDTTATDLFGNENEDTYTEYFTGVLGASYTQFFNANTSQKLTLAVSTTSEEIRVDSLTEDRRPIFFTGIDFRNNIYSAHYLINSKLNARNLLTGGIMADYYDIDIADSTARPDGTFYYNRQTNEGTLLGQAYLQWQHRFTDNLVLNAGVNATYFALNNAFVPSPRLGLKYTTEKGTALSVAYGLHTQLQPLPIYFNESELPNGQIVQGNRDLGFTLSHHFVVGYDRLLAPNLRLKAEAYYQAITDAAVERESSSFSMLNAGADFALPDETDLINNGTGRNYGVELTLEKYYSNNYYMLFTTSLFSSTYKGSDGIRRNTAFNGGYVVNLLAGKEFKLRKPGRTFIADFRLSAAGGRYVTPIDFDASALAGFQVNMDNRAFANRLDDYFRTDIKLGYRINGAKVTHEIMLDIQNIFNTQNVFNQSYNRRTNEITTVNQLGIFPIPQYRITF